MASATPSWREKLKGRFPDAVFEAWEADGVSTLLPIQSQALDTDILDAKSCLVIGPTSCGKTFIGELACVHHALAMRPCLYLVPFKALAEEKYAEFSRKYGQESVGANVVISTADRRQADRAICKGDFTIAILTYEKLSALMVSHPGILKNAGAIVVDEIQMISDDSRGAGLELLLTRAKQIAPHLQIIGLSAVVSELNGFDEWLGAQVISNDHRPVTLREGVMTRNGRFKYVEWQADQRTDGEETLHAVTGAEHAELAVSLAAKLLENVDEQVLMFTDTVRGTKELADIIRAKATHLTPATSVLGALSDLEVSETVTLLQSTLAKSVAFHNADMTAAERLEIERGFRNGAIRCVVSTSTLSMGVNMPASTVIVSSHTKWAVGASGSLERVPLSVAEYRNMSGRAGRFGLCTDQFGRSIALAKSPFEQDAFVNSYVHGTPSALESAFLKRPLNVLLLQAFASGLCSSVDGCFRFLLKTFAARTAWNTDASQKALEKKVQVDVGELIENGLLKKDKKEHIEITELGRICAASGLGVDTFLVLVDFVKSGNTSSADVAFIASQGAETGPDAVGLSRLSTAEYNTRTKFFLRSLRDAIDSEPSEMTESCLDSYPGMPPYEVVRPLKFQTIALAYIRGISTTEVEDKCSVSGGKMRSIGTNCTWLCDTAAKVAWTLGKVDEAKSFEVLADRFQYGCSEAALLLAQIPHRLHRAEREKLVEAGYTSLQSIVDANATEIAKNAKVDRRRVVDLQQSIIGVIGDQLELERLQLARLNAMNIPVKVVEEVYTMKGLLLEQALEEILQPPFCPLRVSRITPQREGEADLKIVLSTGRNGIAQVHAKDKATDRVALTKAGAVLQQSPDLNPAAYICIGRPDFQDDAIQKSQQHASTGKNYKSIPVSVIVEMYVRYHEKRMTPDRVAAILEKETGHISLDRLDA